MNRNQGNDGSESQEESDAEKTQKECTQDLPGCMKMQSSKKQSPHQWQPEMTRKGRKLRKVTNDQTKNQKLLWKGSLDITNHLLP